MRGLVPLEFLGQVLARDAGKRWVALHHANQFALLGIVRMGMFNR